LFAWLVCLAPLLCTHTLHPHKAQNQTLNQCLDRLPHPCFANSLTAFFSFSYRHRQLKHTPSLGLVLGLVLGLRLGLVPCFGFAFGFGFVPSFGLVLSK
jgi:hypothetical protein